MLAEYSMAHGGFAPLGPDRMGPSHTIPRAGIPREVAITVQLVPILILPNGSAVRDFLGGRDARPISVSICGPFERHGGRTRWRKS